MFRSICAGVLAASFSGAALALDADLAETTEIQFGSDAECAAATISQGECTLRAKAAELGKAVDLYEHVRNEHEYVLYQGSRSNAINSFLGQRANDVDMASVLIAMLRARNIPARYVVGTVRIESSKILNWLNVQNLNLAVAILKDQGIQKVVLSADQLTVDLEHVWVEALVSYANYRGAGPDVATIDCAAQRSACRWIGLAPAFKLNKADSSAIDVYSTLNFDYTRYFNAIKNSDTPYKDKNPLEIYEEQVLAYLRASYPGKALEDVSDYVTTQEERLKILPNSLPFQVIGAVRRYNSVTEHDAVAPGASESKKWAKYVRITVVKQVTVNGTPTPDPSVTMFSQKPFLLADLTTKRLTLTFDACGANCVLTQFRLDGAGAGGTLIANGTLSYLNPFIIDFEMDGAPGAVIGEADSLITARYTNNVVGGYYLIGTGGDASNWSQVHRASAELLAANQQYAIVNDAGGVPYVDSNKNGVIDSGEPKLIDNKPAMDALTGGLLYTAMNLYYARFTDSIRQLDALNHVVTPIEGFVGIVSSVYDVDYVDETAFSVMPGGLLIDMKGQKLSGTWRKDAAATFANKHFDLIGHVVSSLEHEIWQELTGYDAISTVRGIQFALAAGATLANPKKNSTTDTVPASYPAFGFASTAPSPFILRERTIFATRQASWAAAASPVYTFEVFKASTSTSDSALRQSRLTYASNNGIDPYLANMDSTENTFLANPNGIYTATICGVQRTLTGSQQLPYLQSCYYSTIDSPSNAAFFDYLDENQGFVPSAHVYRSAPAAVDQHSTVFTQQLRNNLYLITSAHWREYTLAGKLSVGPNFRFTVYVDKVYENVGDKLVSLSFIIQNLSLFAGGGYVDDTDSLEQHEDTTGAVFNNEVFTDQNLNALVNNDLIKTPSTVDPVSTVTGNMYHDETDVVLKGRGLNYSFTRTYNSGPTNTNTGNGVLGPSWTHSYNMRLVANDYGKFPNYPTSLAPENANSKTSSITYVDERGGEVNYLVSDLGGTPTYAVTSPRGIFDTLALNSPVTGQYTLTFRNGVKYIFEGGDLKIPANTARLKSIQDPYGNQLNFTYNGSGKLVTVADNLGISGRTGLTFSYEFISGRLSTVSDWTGRTWSYSYTDSKLASVTNPRSEITTYSYQPNSSLLATITRPQDRGGQKVATTFRYYRNNKTFDYTNVLGQAETMDYDLYRKRTRVTDPRGFVREHYYDDDGVLTKLAEPDGAVLLFGNNSDGLRCSKTNGLGYQTWYKYRTEAAGDTACGAANAYGNVTRETDPLGNKISYIYDLTLFDQLTTLTDKRNFNWTRSYYTSTNALTGAVRGRLYRAFSPLSATVPLQEYTYYANGNVKKKVEYIDLANTAKKRITDYTFDASGLNLLEQIVTGSGQTIRATYTYDSLGRKQTETLHRRKSATDATVLQLISAYEYDNLDRVIKVTDPLGNIAETVYDANSRVTEEKVHYKRPDTTFDTRVYARHEYDLADRRVKSTDIEGFFTTFAYDASSNLIASTDANQHTTRYEYDAMNRRTAVIAANGYRTEMVYDLAGRLIKTIDANNNAARMEYDALGRNTKVITPQGNETQLVYDANNNLIKATDANAVAGLQPKNTFLASVYNEYDSMNRLTKTVDANNGETVYTYDLLGNTLTIRDAELRTTRMFYDDLGRLIQVMDPLIESPTDKISTLTYDEAGNLLTLTDRKGQATRYSYDNLNRLTLTEYLGDATSETRAYNLYGNLDSVANAAVTYTYQYDSKNRLTRKTDTRLNKFLAWTYDPAGMIRTKTDYQGEVTTYQYDSTNRLVSQTNPGYVQVSYHYDPAGRLLDRILSNGARTEYAYDNDNRLTELKNVAANSTLVQNQTYGYDRLRNITTLTDTGGATGYSYDPLYRLLNANAPGTTNDQTYTYDKVGNRKTLVTATGTKYYNYNTGNRLTDVRTTSFTGPIVNSYVYDDNGSRIEKKNAAGTVIQSYTYDQKRRISQLIAGSTTDSFQYDPADYRIQKLDTAGTQKYLLEAEHLEATYDQNNQLLDKYLRGAVVDEIVYGYRKEGSAMIPATYHHDQLQSVTALTGHEGSTQETIKYDAFGNIQSQTGSSGNDLNYTGRERDRDTGLYYYRARYYDPEVGRFLSEDPMGFRAGVNFYAYVNNNPINANDPSGMLSAFEHFMQGFEGSRDAGLGLGQSLVNGVQNAWADVGTQGTDAATAALHVMGGITSYDSFGQPMFVTPDNAVNMGVDLITYNISTGNFMDAGHGSIDLVAEEHGGAAWDGGGFMGLPDLDHILTDWFPSDAVQDLAQANAAAVYAFQGMDIIPNDAAISLYMPDGASQTFAVCACSSTVEYNYSIVPGASTSLYSGASGGYVLYPGRANQNMMQSVYRKGP